MPRGTGKTLKIAAFVAEDNVKEALDAGANKAGTDDLIEEINKGKLDFDIAIASPDQMKKLGKIAKILGQRGLMPSPKAGTISPNIKETISENQ